MEVLQKGQRHIERGAIGTNRLSRFGFVARDKCAARKFRRVEGARLKEAERGSLHEKPADIRFGFSCGEFVDIDTGDALRSFDENIHGMEVTVGRHKRTAFVAEFLLNCSPDRIELV